MKSLLLISIALSSAAEEMSITDFQQLEKLFHAKNLELIGLDKDQPTTLAVTLQPETVIPDRVYKIRHLFYPYGNGDEPKKFTLNESYQYFHGGLSIESSERYEADLMAKIIGSIVAKEKYFDPHDSRERKVRDNQWKIFRCEKGWLMMATIDESHTIYLTVNDVNGYFFIRKASVNIPNPAPSLGIGDPAPVFAPGVWIQGDPIDRFDREHVYVVEFWATWCDPCVTAIPHLNRLHQSFKDRNLVVIGLHTRNSSTEEEVRTAVKGMGERIGYRVALDQTLDGGKTEPDGNARSGEMAKAWMGAAKQGGIPVAFVVAKDGTIAWIGSPEKLTGDIIQKILAGVWNAKAEEAAGISFVQKMAESSGRLYAAIEDKDWKEADRIRDEFRKMEPDHKDRILYDYRKSYYDYLYFRGRRDWTSALSAMHVMTDDTHTDATRLSDHSWSLLSSTDLPREGIDLALALAVRANALVHGQESRILSVLARAQFLHGDKDQAIANQQAAVHVARSEQDRVTYNRTLDAIKAGWIPQIEESP